MGIVAKALCGRGRSWVGGGEWKAVCLRTRPALESCASRLRQSPGLERAAFPVGEIDRQRAAGAGIAVRSAGAEHDHGRRQRDGHDVSQENGASVAGARHGCDPPHGAAAIGTDGEVGCGERAIAFACDCRQARRHQCHGHRAADDRRARLSPRAPLARKP